MARAKPLLEMLELLEPKVREAFLEAVADIRSNVELGRIVTAIESGNVEAALRAMHLDPAAFRGLERILAEVFETGGTNALLKLPRLREFDGGRAVIRFNIRNVGAEQWLLRHSAGLVTGIVEDQLLSIREALNRGMLNGANPRQTALDIVGRVNRVTGRREGGIIGITREQASYVATALDDLLSGDPKRMRHYLSLGRRDRHFDDAVRKALAEGRAIDRAMAERMAGRYSDRLLELRGTTLARTETMAALGAAKHEAYMQAIASGTLDPNLMTKVWKSAPFTEDARVQHQMMRNQEVPFLDRFRAPDGTLLDYPGDPAAPIRHTANCRCDWDVRIDYFAGVE